MYIGITEQEWYENLKDTDFNEINFWKLAGNFNFKALDQGDMFLFKLHSPNNYIVGGGFFELYDILPSFTVWDIFKEKNGVKSLMELEQKAAVYSSLAVSDNKLKNLGCIVLSKPFFLQESDWIPIPEDWNINIGHGKLYNTFKGMGKELFMQLEEKINMMEDKGTKKSKIPSGFSVKNKNNPPEGEGAFKIRITESYHKSCAITGYKVLPALEAGYIKPLNSGGTNNLDNGIFLRKDLYTLFNMGYITIDDNYEIHISCRLKEDFSGGNAYYKYNGKTLRVLPDKFFELPNKSNLRWHMENVFLK